MYSQIKEEKVQRKFDTDSQYFGFVAKKNGMERKEKFIRWPQASHA